MVETYPLTAAQDPISGEYQQVLHWRVGDQPARLALIQGLAIPMFVLQGLAFSILAIQLGKLPATFNASLLEAGATLVAVGVAVVATVILHEMVHGLIMRWCGAQPRYGVLWKRLLFYATSPGYGFRRNSWVLMALAPLVGLSGLAILGMFLLQGTAWVALLALCATINASGAVGDVWLVSIVLRYPKMAYVVDERDGVRVLMRRG